MGHPPIFIMGGSGGIGKSTTARELASALATRTTLGMQRVCLVDANLGQQTQRDYHGIPQDKGLEQAALTDDITDALAMPRTLAIPVPYAILPGPLDPRPDNLLKLWDTLGRALGQVSHLCDWTIVDLDKTDAVALNDHDGVCGRVVFPWVDGGDARMLFKLASSADKLADGMTALNALHHPNALGIIGVITPGAPNPTPDQWTVKTSGYGTFLGMEHWTTQSGQQVSARQVGSIPPEWEPPVFQWLGVTPKPDNTHHGRGLWPFRRH